MQDQHRFNVKAWLIWTAGFLAFPIAGIVAEAVAGRINDVGSALVGGLVAGAVIGTGQWLVARRLLGDPRVWIPATAVAMGIGLLAGAWVVGYGTSLGELALMGAITGIPLGAAQALSAPRPRGQRLGVGGRDAAAVGARVDGDDRRRHRCRPPVRGLRGRTARSPSWPCPGCCWTGSAPPACPHRPCPRPGPGGSPLAACCMSPAAFLCRRDERDAWSPAPSGRRRGTGASHWPAQPRKGTMP